MTDHDREEVRDLYAGTKLRLHQPTADLDALLRAAGLRRIIPAEGTPEWNAAVDRAAEVMLVPKHVAARAIRAFLGENGDDA